MFETETDSFLTDNLFGGSGIFWQTDNIVGLNYVIMSVPNAKETKQ